MSELNEELALRSAVFEEIVEVNARPGQRSRDTFVKSTCATLKDNCYRRVLLAKAGRME
jgi:hypothetical protein